MLKQKSKVDRFYQVSVAKAAEGFKDNLGLSESRGHKDLHAAMRQNTELLFEPAYSAKSLLAVNFRHDDIYTDKIVWGQVACLLKRLEAFLCRDGAVTFAETREEGLQQGAAGEVVFYD